MDVARVVGCDESIPSVLDAIARVLTDTVGFAGVVINVYRPQWDDYEAATVLGPHEMREHCSARPTTRPGSSSSSTSGSTGAARTSSPRAASTGRTAAHRRALPARADRGARRRRSGVPGDELFVPCRDSDGEILAIISLGEPVSGQRSSDTELDFLVAVGRHAALALEQAHRTAEASRHRAALEHLLAVSSKLAENVSIESVLRRSATASAGPRLPEGPHRARRPRDRHAAPRASAGWAAPPGAAVGALGRGDRPAARPRPSSAAAATSCPTPTGRARRAGLHRLRLDDERPRPARVGPPLPVRAAPRRDRRDRRAHLGRRARGPAAALAVAPCRRSRCSPARR